MEWLTLVVVLVLAIVAMRIIGFVFSLLWTLVLGTVVGLIARGMMSEERKPRLWTTAQAGAAGGLIGQLLAWTVWRHHGILGSLLFEIAGAAGAVALLGGRRSQR